jgi:MEMO1 family protein
MAEPSGRSIRLPAVAGSFYPAEAGQCRRQAEQFVRAAAGKEVEQTLHFNRPPSGAIVPHAGWICSGAIAGRAIRAVAAGRPEAQIVVVFGAVHTPMPLDAAALDSHDVWQEPGADSAVAEELRKALAGERRWFTVDDRFHWREHAVEVELPLIQAAWPNARILPVEVPASMQAIEIGRAAAKAAAAAGGRAVYLASSDLTHYGPAYQFTPAGVGAAALAWAKENDRRLLAMVTAMTPERIVPEVQARRNACGAGAIAAMMAACLEQGAQAAAVLCHASSFETLAGVAPQRPDNAVGYAAVIVG